MRKKILIDGEWIDGGESIAVANPFSMETIAEVGSANRNDMERATSAADAARKQIADFTRAQIAAGLQKISEGIQRRKMELARTIAEESAKPWKYALAEVERAVSTFHWAAGEAERFHGEIVPVDGLPNGVGKTARSEWTPRGIIYGITPFNFPLNLVAHKVAPALAAKNAIIIKPSPKTPLTALLLGEIFLESGLPPAALQIVPMDVAYIDSVLSDDRIAMISFTGSDQIGWQLKEKSGRKAIALELGGDAPVIVDGTADIGAALDKTFVGAFAYSGQVCISVQRIYVEDQMCDEWTEKFVARAKNLKIENPLEERTEFSVMIDEAAADKTESIIDDARRNGAEILCGGTREANAYAATVLTKTSPEMRVVGEEAFAPLAMIEKFSEFEEAIEMCNQSKFGLQAGVFSNNFRNIKQACEKLEYGGVIVNDAPTFRADNMPYGGIKQSGFGREGVRYAMEEMSQLKLIVIN